MKLARLLLAGTVVVLFMADAASGVRGTMNINGEVERELTFEIAAGREECFYETAQKGNIIDIEYQVRNFFDVKVNGFWLRSSALLPFQTTFSFQFAVVSCLEITFSFFVSKCFIAGPGCSGL